MYTLCHHITTTGKRCQSPALTNTRFCYYHGRRVRPAASSFPFVFPGDHDAIQHNLALIPLALQEGRISPSVATAIVRACRAASANLKASSRLRRKSPKCIDGEILISSKAQSISPSAESQNRSLKVGGTGKTHLLRDGHPS